MLPERTLSDQAARVARETLYSLAETLKSLRHNLVMTLGIVLAVGVSLTLFGGGLLLQRQVDLVTDEVYDQVEVTIFLCNGISCESTLEQQEALATALEEDERIVSVTFESQEEAYANFSELFADRPDLVSTTPADALPPSFRLQLLDATEFARVAADYRDEPGVDEVVDQRELLEQMFGIAELIVRATWGIAAVQLTAALVLVYTSVRIAAVNRRPQTRIMKHLGASNRYIRTPFVLEAVFGSTVGALSAGAILWWSVPHLVVQASQALQVPYINDTDLLFVGGVMVAVGVACALVTSWFALRRHLKV